MSDRVSSTVKRLDRQKGSRPLGVVHEADMRGEGYRNTAGQAVQFNIAIGPKGPQAIDVSQN
jgi:hypothetical protein